MSAWGESAVEKFFEGAGGDDDSSSESKGRKGSGVHEFVCRRPGYSEHMRCLGDCERRPVVRIDHRGLGSTWL